MKQINRIWIIFSIALIFFITGCKDDSVHITYNLNGGIATDLVTEATQNEKLKLVVPTREGYEFDGWYKTYDFSGDALTEIIVDEQITLYAKWLKINNIIYDLNGGIQESLVKEAVVGDLVYFNKPVREGYEFTGWYLDYDFNSEPISFIKITKEEDIYVVAGWEVINYRIKYYLDGGVNNENNLLEYNVETKNLVLNDPLRIGYTFDGWYDNPEFSGEALTKISTLENINLYAKWTKGYLINYNLNGGQFDSEYPTRVYQDEELIVPSPYKEHARFKGWYVDSSYTKTLDEITNEEINSSITLYAKWAVAYNLEYVVRDGIMPEEYLTSYEPGLEEILPIPSKQGYEFKGWSDSETSDRRKYFSVPISYEEDLKLYAVWEKEYYSVDYVLGEYAFATKEQLFRAFFGDFYDYLINERDLAKRLEKSSIYTKEDFLAFCSTYTGGAAGMGAIGNLLGSYYLTIDTGGKLEDQVNKEGYIGYCLKNNMYVEFIYFIEDFFYYWRLEEGYTGGSGDPENTGSDFLASAWASVVDTAKFFYYDPNASDDDPHKLPSYFFREGYQVPGFYDRIPYMIELNDVVFEYVYDWEKEIILPTTMVKPGYTFVGWYLNEDFTGEKITKIPAGIYHDITIYAKFVENK